ncbi:MAG TPA: sigma-70 family RNA polymerase sigma factor [Polyangiaceae bacterium]|jgi:RNA polymerase sigma-70 factor (ECF subfamily)|nr:sigma-70 family RNA polymerase sigma factor [Polyangiaceae bacterium]
MMDEARPGHQSTVVQVDTFTAEAPSGPRQAQAFSDAERATRLRALVDTHFDFIWRSLRRFGLSAADADDAAQRVFVVASRKLELVEQGRERSFLFGTAYRVVREIRRAKARRPESPLPGDGDEMEAADPSPNPEEFADRSSARALLDQVLAEMPIDSRSVFVLFELEEMTVPEIASMLELPVGTIASRLRRARELFHAAATRLRARATFNGVR